MDEYDDIDEDLEDSLYEELRKQREPLSATFLVAVGVFLLLGAIIIAVVFYAHEAVYKVTITGIMTRADGYFFGLAVGIAGFLLLVFGIQAKRSRVWCVLHENQWCVVEDGYQPDQFKQYVLTSCDQRVQFPFVIQRRKATCPQCINALSL
ncbi:hypothetical protein ACFL27_05150 [candidate division CSSED10-310 bacterium]|uniref:Transmembrane protein n=1 Tax=candidate division CSSED10-310 bacterium TaxID=2855610 RepID=A0ABV6YTR1_UNCC1